MEKLLILFLLKQKRYFFNFEISVSIIKLGFHVKSHIMCKLQRKTEIYDRNTKVQRITC